jgi:hypothetical protein
LGIGYEKRSQDNWQREWVYWYDEHGNRYPDRADATEAISIQERQEKERLAAYLKSIGVDPDLIP